MPAMDLTEVDGAYADAETVEFSSVPDGIYKTIIAGVDFKFNRQGEKICSWRHKIIDGEHRGASLFKNYSLKSEHLKWLKTDIKKCGCEFKTLSELQNRTDKLLGTECEVAATTKGEYQNIYLRSAIVERPQYKTPPPEDDIPF